MKPFIVHLNMRLRRRFESKVIRTGRGECHLWQGSFQSNTGYPYLHIRSRRAHATKIAYVLHTNPNDIYVNLADLPILGLRCGNRRCVRFEHITPGSPTSRYLTGDPLEI